MTYGVKPSGFVRKPLPVILAEIEAKLITEFGPDVVQTSQSPLGQVNGLFADLVGELWEIAEDLYQSYDPDQAEGTRLDTLARIRLLQRGDNNDEEMRRSLTNEGRARIDTQDLSRAIGGLDGVTFSSVFTNETGEITDVTLERGTVAIAVIGGDDTEIADTIRLFIAPGINTFGNHLVTSVVDGYCRTSTIIRPVEIPVTLDVTVSTKADVLGCPPPSPTAIRDALIQSWHATRINGSDLTHFAIRSRIEAQLPNVEVLSYIGGRDGTTEDVNQPIGIGFTEIANLSEDDVTVTGV